MNLEILFFRKTKYENRFSKEEVKCGIPEGGAVVFFLIGGFKKSYTPWSGKL